MPDLTELLCLDDDICWLSLYFFSDRCAELNFYNQEDNENKYINIRVYVRPLYKYDALFNSFKEITDTYRTIYDSAEFDNLRKLIKIYLNNMGPVTGSLPSAKSWKEQMW